MKEHVYRTLFALGCAAGLVLAIVQYGQMFSVLPE